MKMCPYCKKAKELGDFYNNKGMPDGKDRICKECKNAFTLKWREKNPEKVKATARQYHIANRERERLWHAEWEKKNPEKKKSSDAKYYRKNRERIKKQVRFWAVNNLESRREIARKYATKYYSTIQGKLRNSMSKGMGLTLKGKKGGRHWQTLVPYTVDELKLHLEKQFKPGMTWDNHGTYWQIDHIIPVSVFHFKNPEDIDFQRCWALKNLRPLKAFENRSKGAKLKKPFQPSLDLKVVGL